MNDLHKALVKVGIKTERPTATTDLKKERNAEDFSKKDSLNGSKQASVGQKDIQGFDFYKIKKQYKYEMKTGESQAISAFSNDPSVFSKPLVDFKTICFLALGDQILRHALLRLKAFGFAELRRFFPNLKSTTEFIASKRYLQSIEIEISGLEKQVSDLTAREKLAMALHVLQEIAAAFERP